MTLSVIDHPQVWRGKDWQQRQGTTLDTGFELLNRHLSGGGWPFPAVIELLCSPFGQGEMQLLLPMLRALPATLWQLWVNPPWLPYAPALAHQGIPLARTLIAQPQNDEDTIWCIEHALQSQGASVILAWVNQVGERQLRRLQLACEQSQTLLVLFRPNKGVMPSFASLRLKVQKQQEQLCLDIVKRKHGWPVTGLMLPLESPWPVSG